MTDGQVMNYFGFDEPQTLIQLKQNFLSGKMCEYTKNLTKEAHQFSLGMANIKKYPDFLNDIILLTQNFLELVENKNIYNDGFKCDTQTSTEQNIKMTDEQIMGYFGLKTKDELGQLKHEAKRLYILTHSDRIKTAAYDAFNLASKKRPKNEIINELHTASDSLNKLIAFAESVTEDEQKAGPLLNELNGVVEGIKMSTKINGFTC